MTVEAASQVLAEIEIWSGRTSLAETDHELQAEFVGVRAND